MQIQGLIYKLMSAAGREHRTRGNLLKRTETVTTMRTLVRRLPVPSVVGGCPSEVCRGASTEKSVIGIGAKEKTVNQIPPNFLISARMINMGWVMGVFSLLTVADP